MSFYKNLIFNNRNRIFNSAFLLILFFFCSIHVHSQDSENNLRGSDLAEALWMQVDLDNLKSEVISELRVPKSDRELFFQYLSYQYDREKYDFFQSFSKGEINTSSLTEYKMGLKQKYTTSYQSFINEKEAFRLIINNEGLTPLAEDEPCENMGFESGSREGWTGTTGEACDTDDLCRERQGFDNDQHEIMTVGDDDPYIDELNPVAPGSNNSLRLENTQTGGDAATIRQTFLVSADNNIFTYRYATVLEDPGDHDDEERPYFRVRLYDENGDMIPCATYSAMAKPPLENFTYAPVEGDGGWGGWGGDMELYYRDWTTVSIPLLEYEGENVTIEFVVSDCSRGGHLGYAYIDAECLSIGEIETTTICSGENKEFTAPDNFAAYEWSGGEVNGVTTQTVTIKEPGTYSVTMTPEADNPCPVTEEFEIIPYCPAPDITDTLCETEKGSGITSDISLRDYDEEILETSPTGTVLSWHTDSPESSPSNEITNPESIEVSDGDAFYALVDISNDLQDTVMLTFTINPRPDVNFPVLDDVCLADTPINIDGVTPAGGTFSGDNISAGGQFSPSEDGIFELEYIYEDSNGCADTATQNIKVDPPPTIAEAGPDEEVCVSDYELQGDTVETGTGEWSVFNGGANVLYPDLHNSDVEDLSDGDNVFIWTTTSGVCPPSTDTVVIRKFHELTLPDAGENDSICETTATYSLTGNAVDADNEETARWESLGNATVDPDNSAGTTAGDMDTGDNGFVYHVEHPVCPALSDTVIINVEPSPTEADAGDNDKICSANYTLQGNTPDIGTGKWEVVSGGATITDPSSPESPVTGVTDGQNEFRWTISGNLCPSSNDIVAIDKFEEITEPDAGEDDTICATKTTYSLSGNAVNTNNEETVRWEAPGNATVDPDNTSGTTAENMETGENIFIYHVEHPLCPSVSDTVVISVDEDVQQPTADDIVVCEDSVQLSASAVVPETGSGKWTINSGQGSIASSDDPGAILSGLSDPGETNLTWTVMNGTCGPKDVTVTVTRSADIPEPDISYNGKDVTNDTVYLCLNEPGPHQLEGTSTVADQEGTWSTTSGTSAEIAGGASELQNLNLNEGGITDFNYEVKSTITGGCPPADNSVTVVVKKLPELPGPVTGKTEICTPASGEGYSIPDAERADIYTWSVPGGATINSGQGTTEINVDYAVSATSGDITVTAENECGTAGPATLSVTIEPKLPVSVSIDGPDSICYGDNIPVFNASGNNLGNSPVYEWTLDGNAQGGDVSSLSIGTPVSPGAHTVAVTVTSSIACPTPLDGKASFDVPLEILPRPSVTVSAEDPAECEGEGSVIIEGLQSGDYELYYEDPDPVGPLAVSPDVAGKVELSLPEGTYTNIQLTLNGCPGNIVQAELNDPVLVPEISISPEADICEGEEVKFQVRSANGGSSPQFYWIVNGHHLSHTGGTYETDSLRPDDIVQASMISSSSCASPSKVYSNEIEASVTPYPDPVITGPGYFCEGETIRLNAGGGTSHSSYSWFYNGAPLSGDDSNIEVGNEGSYSVKVSNNGCATHSDPFELDEVIVRVDAGPDQEVRIRDNKATTIKVNLQGTTNGVDPVWNPGVRLTDPKDLSPEAELEAGLHTFVLSDSIGRCTASDRVNVEVNTKVWIPTAISPNGDGDNERWFITGLEGFTDYTVSVYNRYGNIVHRQENSYEPWDGYRNGQPMPVGTYYYVVDVKGDDVYTGNLTIVR